MRSHPPTIHPTFLHVVSMKSRMQNTASTDRWERGRLVRTACVAHSAYVSSRFVLSAGEPPALPARRRRYCRATRSAILTLLGPAPSLAYHVSSETSGGRFHMKLRPN